MPPVKCWKTTFGSSASAWDKVEILPTVDGTRNNHFVHSHLCRLPDFVKRYELHRPKRKAEGAKEVLIAVLHLGPNLAGYPNLIHGGATALLFDDVVGFATDWVLQDASLSAPPPRNAVTAHLSVDFVAGLPLPSTVLVPVRLLQSPQDG